MPTSQPPAHVGGAGSGPGQLWMAGVGAEAPVQVQAAHCVALGCPAARSLAAARIPVVALRVSGVELVSVRGTEFSQDRGLRDGAHRHVRALLPGAGPRLCVSQEEPLPL